MTSKTNDSLLKTISRLEDELNTLKNDMVGSENKEVVQAVSLNKEVRDLNYGLDSINESIYSGFHSIVLTLIVGVVTIIVAILL